MERGSDRRLGLPKNIVIGSLEEYLSEADNHLEDGEKEEANARNSRRKGKNYPGFPEAGFWGGIVSGLLANHPAFAASMNISG